MKNAALEPTDLTSLKEAIVHFLAFGLRPVAETTIVKLFNFRKLPPELTKSLILELATQGLIISTPNGRRTEYRLPYSDYPRFFLPSSQQNQSWFERITNKSMEFTRLSTWRKFFWQHARSSFGHLDVYYIDSDEETISAFTYMFASSPWSSYLPSLRKTLREKFIQHLLLLTETDFQIQCNTAALRQLAQEKKLTEDMAAQLLPIQQFFFKCLRGELALPTLFDSCPESPTLFYIKALRLQYQGLAAKAVAQYHHGIKLAKSISFDNSTMSYSLDYPTSPFFCLMYMVALSQDTRESSKKKLKTIYARRSYWHRLPLSSDLYLRQHFEEEKAATELEVNLDNYHGMDYVLSAFLLKHYQLLQLTSEQESKAVEMIEQNHWNLLKLEASFAFKSFESQREELLKELNITPMFKQYIKLEPWQAQLNKLDTLLQQQAETKQKAASSTAAPTHNRIIYLVDDEWDITPVLQKSKDGQTWTKGRNIALSTMLKSDADYMSEVDKAVARCIRYSSDWYGKSYHLDNDKCFEVLINHPHIYLASNNNISVQILKDTPYLEVKQSATGFRLLSNVSTNSTSNLIVTRESNILFHVFRLSSIQRELLQLIAKQETYPLEAKEKLIQTIKALGNVLSIHSDLLQENKQIRQKEGSSRITVQILPIAEGVKVELFTKPLESTPPYFKAGKGIERCLVNDAEGQVNVTRKMTQERANYRKVRSILRALSQDQEVEDSLFFDEMYDCLELLDQLQDNEKILRIEWPKGAKLSIRGKVDFKQMRLATLSRGQWLQVDGDVQVDEQLQLSLAELLQRSRGNKGRFIELDKGEYLALSEKLRKKLAEIDNTMTEGKKGGLQLSTFRSDLLGDLEEEGAELKADKQYKELQKRIQAAYEQKISIPPALTATLRDYQIDGYEWLCRLSAWGAGACLADDMGLGKSVQSIAIMLQRAELGATLIVAPASVVPNWRREIERFAPSLQCHLLHEQGEQRAKMIDQAGAYDVVITTYGLLSRIDASITQKEWNIILLDEAHNIKNRDTKCSKTAMSLQGQFRLALTGTPIQNHLGEIWNLFQFTNPGLLGSFEQFKEKYILPIEKDKDRVRQQQLKRMIQPFLLRRTKSEVLEELPTKTEIIHHVELSPKERALYENIRQHALLSLEQGELNPIQTLAEITKLRQAACHPLLIDSELPLATSAKLQRLLEIVAELKENKHSALVFSQFSSFLKLVAKSLDALGMPYFYLDGQTAIKERERLVAEFQQGKVPLFLISLKAGGTGLNLTAADYVIHMDPWWNPAIEDQASDRSHRIGQTRPVTIYKLIATQTIEERILEMHKNKRSLSDSLLEGGDMSTKLSKKEIMDMLQSRF